MDDARKWVCDSQTNCQLEKIVFFKDTVRFHFHIFARIYRKDFLNT